MEGNGSARSDRDASFSVSLWDSKMLEKALIAVFLELESEKGRGAHQTLWRRETDRCGPWSGEDDSHCVGQVVRPHEPCIQQNRAIIAELDPIRFNQNHKTTAKYLLPNGHGWQYFCTMATAGTLQKPAISSYLCSPVNQHSKCNNNYSQSPPICGNQKDEDPWKGSKEEDNDPNGGTTVITIRDEDHKRGHSYKSSFASGQSLTLAVSSLLLCLMVLFPNFAQKNQAITAAALMGATLGSLVSLETILKCPSLARTCGYFAIISLLVAVGSILSTSANWVTI